MSGNLSFTKASHLLATLLEDLVLSSRISAAADKTWITVT